MDEAAGNSLALAELPKALHLLSGVLGSGPLPLTERLERAFTARVSQLPADTRTILPIAALNDSAAVAETLDAAALVLGTRVGVTALAPAVPAQLIELGAGTITFRHPLMRSAISQTTGADERQRAHAALAEVLSGQVDRRAWHRAAATSGTDESVAGELDATADLAQRRGVVTAAIADARDRLTAHELHIAQLAAEGLTNREIGQRLYLSHRTVSTHLHRIFPKLGITSRADLGTVLQRGSASPSP